MNERKLIDGDVLQMKTFYWINFFGILIFVLSTDVRRVFVCLHFLCIIDSYNHIEIIETIAYYILKQILTILARRIGLFIKFQWINFLEMICCLWKKYSWRIFKYFDAFVGIILIRKKKRNNQPNSFQSYSIICPYVCPYDFYI